MAGLVEQLMRMALRDFGPKAEEIKRVTWAYLLAALLFITAYVALVMSAAFYISFYEGPVMAGLVIAAAAIVIALIVIVVVMIMNRQTRLRALAYRNAYASQPNLMAGAFSQLPNMVRESPIATTVMMASFAFALAKASGIGRKPRRD